MRKLILWLVVPALCGCSSSAPVAPPEEIPTDGLRVLFVGNSLTYTNNLPGLVHALATRAGQSMSYGSIVQPGYALEDHWYDGLPDRIATLRPDVVVMQQGPSSLPENKTHLVTWTRRLSAAVRAAGGEPALYMVWPDDSRRFAFSAVHDSYATAAAEVDGMFIPAGNAWLEAWKLNPALRLYGPDGFHPTYLGSLVAAHTIYAVLFDADPLSTPTLDDRIPAATVQVVREAVAASITAHSESSAAVR